MDANWHVVALDFILILELWLIGIWFSGNLGRWSFLILTWAFLSMGLGFIVITIGDVAIALGDPPAGVWFLDREWRALPWRVSFVLGFATVAGVLRFGKFDGPARKKR